MKKLVPFILLLLTACNRSTVEHKPITSEELMIQVFGESREVAFTNKQAGFFYTETNASHRTSWQGWHIMAKEVLEDYQVTIDNKPLRKADVHLAMVFPHQIQRAYPMGVQETVTQLDSMNAIVVELAKVKGNTVTLRPFFSNSHLLDDYIVKSEQQVLLIAQKRHLQRTKDEDYPVWIGITFANASASQSILQSDTVGANFSPAGIQSLISDPTLTIILVAGDTEEQTITQARDVSKNYSSLIVQRKERIERVLNNSYVRTNDERFDKALRWAIVSMDALIMNQMKKGIFAGLPWFANYWGRDSFISLPGATLVTGNFPDAKEILRSFAEWQETNPKSPNYGRIPNIVTTSTMQYNTVDGTPRFIMALNEYLKYSGDTTFVKELYPVVKRSIEGSLSYHVDDRGFLTHGDAETWMDAVGPEGPWSPRGNRANDIQALWFQQLRAGEEMAELVGDTSSKKLWGKIKTAVLANFKKYFADSTTGLIADHLNSDGTQDHQLRPSQIVALPMADSLFDILKSITEKLVYPYGVASLSQEDENFHPYHHYSPYYVQDAAYHNGIVWTWLAGAWIDAAVNFGLSELAFQVTDNMTHQILDRGAVGTLSELLDAAPRPGEKEPRLSGAFSQAWSLAEFIRVWYQDYLGVFVDASKRTITLAPKLPSAITQAKFIIAAGSNIIDAEYFVGKDNGKIILNSRRPYNIKADVYWKFQDGSSQLFSILLPPQKNMLISIGRNEVVQEIDGKSSPLPLTIKDTESENPKLKGVRLATPVVNPSLKALKGPSHRLLRNAEIKPSNPISHIVYDVSDPVGDDKGSGNFTYPLTTNLKPGSLDITHFTVSADEKHVYFKMQFQNLSNPAWHPEYGFQLTYAAIAIDKDGKPGSGQTNVGMNSNYLLDKQFAFENIIYVGGGFRVVDARGTILAEYLPIPGDEQHPLGDTKERIISFAIPTEILGMPEPSWRYTVLVGCQDDHGGAGVGDFRSVEATAKEWIGGGKKKPLESNVYDIILPLNRR
ncbi:MAG: hypothetical protein HY088_03780 [Ignavibacteriales bacterium]|nr:hypothetical protein [Ignavibacteriales bacterium]